MSYDPKKRDSSWHMVQPGCYIDPAGLAHLFPDEIVAYLAVTHPQAGFDVNSKKDYDLVVEIFLDMLRRIDPKLSTRYIRHDREQN